MELESLLTKLKKTEGGAGLSEVEKSGIRWLYCFLGLLWKVAQIRWLKMTEIYSLIALEDKCKKRSFQLIHALFKVSGGPIFASSHFCFQVFLGLWHHNPNLCLQITWPCVCIWVTSHNHLLRRKPAILD